MKISVLMLLSFVFLMGCNSSEKPVVTRTKHVNTSYQAPEVAADRTLTVSVKGMMCEMGCGASIRKELLKTKAVDLVEFDFVDERKSNTAKLNYDSNLISKEKIVSILNTMNDHQFEVSEINDVNLDAVSQVESNSNSGTSDETASVDMSSNSLEVPNLFQLLTQFFIQ